MSKCQGSDGRINSLHYATGGVGAMEYGMMTGGGGNYPSRMPPGGGEMKKGPSMVTNSMCYREQPRPKSPHRFQPPPMNTILDDFDRPDSPPDGAGGYNDDRIHNDLLEEICSDIGIRDTMDLDFLDFDGSEAFTKLPAEDGDCFDQTIPFGQYPENLDRYQGPAGGRGEKLSVSIGGFDNKNGVSDSIASPTVSSTSPRLQSDCPRPSSIGSLGSPAVHSTTHAAQTHQGVPPSPAGDDSDGQRPGSLNSRASSFDSLVDSPATVIAAKKEKDQTEEFINLDDLPPYKRSTSHESGSTDSSKLKNLKEFSSVYGRGPPTPSSVVAQSPMKGHAIKSEGKADNSTFDQDLVRSKMHMNQFKPVQSPSVGTTVSTTGVSTSLASRPPQTSFSSGNTSASIKQECSRFQHPASVDDKPPRSAESPFDLGYASMGSASVCTESLYGSMTSLDKMSMSSSGDMGSREKVMSYLHRSIPPNVPNFIPPAPFSQSTSAHVPGNENSSLPDSPPQERVAKRARTINSGTDLLDCMREQYSFVKGADMYAKPKYPSVPVQRARPTPFPQQGGHMPSSCGQEPMGMGGQNQPNLPQCQQQQSMTPYPGSSGSGPVQDRGGMVSPNPLASAPAITNNMCAPPQGGYSAQPSQPMMNHSMSQRPENVPQTPCNNPYARNNGYAPNNGSCEMGMTPTPAGSGFSRPGYDSRPPVARPRMAAQEMGPMMSNRQHVQQFHGQMQQQGQSQGPGSMNYSQHYNQSQYNGGSQLRHKVPHSGLANQNPPNCYGGGGGGSSASGTQWPQDNNNMQSAIPQMPNIGRPMNSMSPVDPNMSPQVGHMTGNRPQYPMGHQYNQQQPMNIQQQDHGLHRPMGTPQMRSQQQPINRSQMNPSVGMPQGSNAYHSPMVPNQQLNTPGGMGNPPMTPQQGLMHHIITDKSNSFRSHPLFPLLRDLIIADMNFHSPSFPFQLIANLPADFDKLLQNYMNRNPNANYQSNDAVNGVLMDALKYAHRAIIEKIKVKKQQEGYKEPPRPLSAIEDFCERFDKAVRNSMDKPEDSRVRHAPSSSSSSLLASKSLSASMPLHPLKSSSPAPDHCPSQPSPGHGSASLPCTPSKSQKAGSRAGDGDATKGSSSSQSTGGGGGKNKVLPKEAVAVMLSWLREHQDNPYPNDDEKEMLINKTKLTINQINYWFTNARRRILPKWALQRYMEQQQQQHQYATQMHMLGAPH